MRKNFTSIVTLLLLCITINVSSKNPAGENTAKPNYHGSEYKAGSLVIRVKPEYRSVCSINRVEQPKLLKALNRISYSTVSKKFPWISPPAELVNKDGNKLVDLSLIYEVEFSPVVRIEEAMSIVQASGIVMYAEPIYKCRMDFNPNDPSLGQQYALTKINAFNAWDIWTGDTNVVIGIVDSGTDWDHPDLAGNIKYNYADPIDNVDNDVDGFIDNYRGWDVSDHDNNPMVGVTTHGSHVSGCANAVTNNSIGVAAPAFNCKFLPVKSSLQNSSLIDNGFDGIVYAADHGASVINCSWGRTGYVSQFEQNTVEYATFNKNALVVAAAGNDGVETKHYPSSYDNVISVAATGNSDGLAGFSNYGETIDVCAPGVNIYSTIYNDNYTGLDGTSMASPIAAGCAAMIKSRFPSLSALQVGEQLRTTCDNIYGVSGNAIYMGKMGKGRVNLFKAVTDSISPGVVVQKNIVTDNSDEVFMPGDTLSINSLFQNLLRPTTNLTCSLVTSSTSVQILQNNFNGGVLNTMDTISNFNSLYRVYIKPTAPLNTEVTFRIILTDGTWNDSYSFKIVVNVDYVNIAINNVATSISSRGLIGYNQTGQLQGLGFTYKGSPTILYDMGVMIGDAVTQVSDAVRGAPGNDEDFASVTNVVGHEPGTISDFDVNGVFNDYGLSSGFPLNILVSQHAYAWVGSPDDNYIMVQFIIKNNGTSAISGLYGGIFADWDIPQYANNKCSTDNARRMGYVWSTDSAGLYGGIKLLSHTGTFNHYALDNTQNNGGIEMNDGFDNSEKYTSLSTARANSGTATTPGNDVLSVVSSGSYNIAAGDSVEVAFALIAGKDLAELQAGADAAQIKYDNTFIGIVPIADANTNKLYQNYPNPADKELRISFDLKETNNTSLCIYNILGEKVKTVFDERLNQGKYNVIVDVQSLPSGNYFYRLTSGSFVQSLPMSILH